MSAFIGEIEFWTLVILLPVGRLSFFSWLCIGRANARLDYWTRRYGTKMSRNGRTDTST
jgi:hypothetical protein